MKAIVLDVYTLAILKNTGILRIAAILVARKISPNATKEKLENNFPLGFLLISIFMGNSPTIVVETGNIAGHIVLLLSAL